jgi:hypothetical protein
MIGQPATYPPKNEQQQRLPGKMYCPMEKCPEESHAFYLSFNKINRLYQGIILAMTCSVYKVLTNKPGRYEMKSFKVMLIVVFVLALAVAAYAQDPGWGGYGPGYGMGPGMMGGWGGYGGYGMGHGMMGGWGGYGQGYGMGPGMMGGWGGYGQGYGMGPGMMGGWGGYGMGPGMMYGWGGGYGPGYGRGPGYGYNQSEECQNFFDDTAKLRKELHSKRFEYFEAYRNPDTKPDTLAKLDREIRALQEKIYEKAPEGCGW